MKKLVILTLSLAFALQSFAQLENVKVKLYGEMRNYVLYNSHASQESADGGYFLYPLDKIDGANGDLNNYTNGTMYCMHTRMGLKIAVPDFLGAKATAKIEMDFRGFSTTIGVVRMRHAYFNLDWGKSTLLVGQTWHPLFGDVSPDVINLATGAPFQPFSRSPQIRYRYTNSYLQLTGALVWQTLFNSKGPKGSSEEYIRNSGIPEIFGGVNYVSKNFLAGVGAEVLSLKPLLYTEGTGGTYKTNERITTISYEAHLKYAKDKWFFAAKSTMGSNLTQTGCIGGFGVKANSINKETGKQEYTPITTSSSWLNIVYGKKWKEGIFVGYMKNLGSNDALESTSPIYGNATNMDQLANVGLDLTYNLPHWKFGIEGTVCKAKYGTIDLENGKVKNTHSVTNNRIMGNVTLKF